MSYNNCQFTWLKQKETLISLAESLLKDSAFYDCQLCAEGHHFNVHRVILSCNSPIFRKILEEHNSDLPVITLEGISSIELGALVEFIYTGVTRIAPHYLKNFFQIAKSLQLAGLNHYDNSQIDKIINESDTSTVQSDVHDNYDTYSQNILHYLNHSEDCDEAEVRDLTNLNENDSIFVDESPGTVHIDHENVMLYKNYGDFIKEESSSVVESQFVESDETCEAVSESPKRNLSTFKGSFVFDKFHNVFIKNEDKVVNNNLTYTFSNTEDTGVAEENDFVQLPKEVKVTTAKEEKFVFVKLDEITFDKPKESQLLEGKRTLSKNDVQLFTKKCLRVFNPGDKELNVKKPRIQSAVKKEAEGGGTDDKKIYICLKCGNKYSHRRTLLHHIHWICEQPATYSCSLCPYRGKRKFQLKSHMKHAHLFKMI